MTSLERDHLVRVEEDDDGTEAVHPQVPWFWLSVATAMFAAPAVFCLLKYLIPLLLRAASVAASATTIAANATTWSAEPYGPTLSTSA